MLASLDLLLLAIAFMIMLMSTARRWSVWRKGKPEVRNGSWKDLIGNLIGQGRNMRKPYTGTAHMLLFFGFFAFVALVVLSQTHLTVPRPISYILSFFSEVLGFFMLLATFHFVVKRLKSRKRTLRALFPLVILTAILLSGFLSEGTRLSITASRLSWQYPIGWFLSLGLPVSPTLLQVLIRCHFFLVLLFVATVPFTLMRHAAAAPLNTYFRSRCGIGSLKQMDFDNGPFGARVVMDFSWKQLLDAESCISCSRCEEVCPAHLAGKPLSPMNILGNILKQMEEVRSRNDDRKKYSLLKESITGEEIWSCTTCLACIEQCPVFIDPMDKIIDLRRHAVLGGGGFPQELQTVFENIEIYGDVYGQGVPKRKALASALGLKVAAEAEKTEWLLWLGCQASFHERVKDSMKKTIDLLRDSGFRMSILGKEEICCGDLARRSGNEFLFEELARRNIQTLKKYKINRIMTFCPHCLSTLKHDYQALGGNFEVCHYTEVLWDKISSGRLHIKPSPEAVLTLQDPCYLSRANPSTELPRKILQAVPDVRFHEMKNVRTQTNCCGGGGGGLWMQDHGAARINDLRAKEAYASGADVLITLCPYCLTMLEDGIKNLDIRGSPVVKDLGEFVAQCV